MGSSAFRLAEVGRCLDPRPADVALRNPYLFAVNVPSDELSSRIHELPSKDATVLVAGFDSHAEQAVQLLVAGGRAVRLVDAEHGESGPLRLWKPNDFLSSLLPQLQTGRALDLGCGSGRDTLAMAAAGFRVDACDILPDALDKGKDLARRYLIPSEEQGEPSIRWLLRDIEADGPPPGRYDLIVSIRFLHRPLLKVIGEFLNPGGSLVLETFTSLHRQKHGKPSSDHHVLRPGELAALAPGLEVMQADEGWRGEIHTGRLWAMMRPE